MLTYILTPVTRDIQRLTIQAPLSLLSADTLLAELEAVADSLDGRLNLLIDVSAVGRFSTPLVYSRYASLLRRYPELRIAIVGASRSILYGLTIIEQLSRAADRLRVFECDSEALGWLANRPAMSASGV